MRCSISKPLLHNSIKYSKASTTVKRLKKRLQALLDNGLRQYFQQYRFCYLFIFHYASFYSYQKRKSSWDLSKNVYKIVLLPNYLPMYCWKFDLKFLRKFRGKHPWCYLPIKTKLHHKCFREVLLKLPV